MTRTVSDAVATRDGITTFMDPYAADFRAVLPSHVNAEQWIRLTAGVLRRNNALAKVAQSNPGSLVAAMLDAARLGLEVGDTYHLVPFGAEVVGIADYTGLIELAYRAGETRSIKAEVVYANDHFRYVPGDMNYPEFRPDWMSDRGAMVGAFAYAELKDGSFSQVIVRNKQEIEKVRAVSRGATAKDSPWSVWPDRQWRKTVLRELMKFIPTSAEYRREKIRAEAAVQQVAIRHDLPPAPTEVPDLDADVVDGEVVSDDQAATTEWPATAKPGGGS
jgi:recombination protein RecT